jgi:hypothetical protein
MHDTCMAHAWCQASAVVNPAPNPDLDALVHRDCTAQQSARLAMVISAWLENAATGTAVADCFRKHGRLVDAQVLCAAVVGIGHP